jgi:hypothetical protein
MKSNKFYWLILISLASYISWKEKPLNSSSSIITNGQMPNLTTDKAGNLHLVFGKGDSILYTVSVNQGETFSKPFLVALLPQLTAAAMRGPQIAVTDEGVTILAANGLGNIYSYWKGKSGNWVKGARVNDLDTVAKEGFMALSGDGRNLFAVWLDLRGNKRNKIVGAKSINAGKTWSKNILLYASPDSVVCECCKPSVAVKANNVFAMFRNNLHGNRDLYLIQSQDGGNNFGNAQKLGNGSWALNGCPMDGGGITMNPSGTPQTVWRRQSKIFTCEPGKQEIEIGEGRNCSIESVNGKNAFAWTENGEVVCVLPDGKKRNLGKGALPIIKRVSDKSIICIWEQETKIYKAVLEL